MGVIFGIIGSLLMSFADIFWKNALKYNCPKYLFMVLGWTFSILVIPTFLWMGLHDMSSLTWGVYAMIVGVLISMFVVIRIGTYVRSHEKISVITPYSNINKILSIIFAFFIFGKVSIEAFVIAIIAGIIVIVGSIDFKTLQVPKFIKVFAIHQLLTSINILIIGKILEKITFIDYFILSGSTFIITLWIIVFSRKEYIELSRLPRYFYANRLSASFLGMSSDLVGFFLIASIGVVMSILLSFIYIAFILVLSFLFFGDRPSKKNIFLTLILVLLIGCGYYLK